MKRTCWIALTLALVLICLAGCSGGLQAEEFYVYDANGNVKTTFDDLSEEGAMINLLEGDFTYRKIGLGSTKEEVMQAYGDRKELEWHENSDGTGGFQLETDIGIISIGTDAQDKVDLIILMDKSKMPWLTEADGGNQ